MFETYISEGKFKMTIPQNVSELLEFYSKELSNKSIKNLKTTLRRYILPFLGDSKKVSHELDWLRINRKLEEISIAEFRRIKPEDVLNEQLAAKIEIGSITRRTANGYRSEFRKLITWMQKQDWYIEAARVWDGKCAP